MLQFFVRIVKSFPETQGFCPSFRLWSAVIDIFYTPFIYGISKLIRRGYKAGENCLFSKKIVKK